MRHVLASRALHVCRMEAARPLAPALILFACASCATAPDPAPSPECTPLWSTPAAAEFVEALTAATTEPFAVWPGYGLDDGVYVLHAGDTESGEACLGLWRGGRVLGYAQLPTPPRLSTPLYGYLLPEAPGTGGSGFPPGQQPEELRAWTTSLGIQRATIMPVVVEDFPMELPALVKAQLALHEAFHVEVQSPHWSGAGAAWPRWDRQPDRAGVRACYAATPEVEATFAEERESLALMVEALLEDGPAEACRAGEAFLEHRAARYALLDTVVVTASDNSPGTCPVAEAIMELEEGTADWASWTKLFQLGRAGLDQLMRRYRAVQDDAFYLTGAMQLHAVELMEPEAIDDVTDRIATSATADTGAIQVVFEEVFGRWCR